MPPVVLKDQSRTKGDFAVEVPHGQHMQNYTRTWLSQRERLTVAQKCNPFNIIRSFEAF